jgi:dolichol-phosphate mannosyltransferase
MATPGSSDALQLLSVIIPARNEVECIGTTVQHLALELRLNAIPHEIVVVDDGSTDGTWTKLQELSAEVPTLKPVQNPGPHGFGRAIIFGFEHSAGDSVVVMMADESDDCRDVVRYWQVLNEGWDCVFGSRYLEIDFSM